MCARCFASSSCPDRREVSQSLDRLTTVLPWTNGSRLGLSPKPGAPLRTATSPRTAERLGVPESSRANADDRLPVEPLGRVEGGDGIVEGRDGADVGAQPSVAHPIDD